ncbi:MAG: M23 family metallopeptidase [Flavobacteriaceae bacterium]|nr:M23 family metallopeptidase [Flavobacteriaceae bacterium]
MRRELIFILLISSSLISQNNLLKQEKTNPLDIPIILSGTYGELRSNHFHSGIDIKTKGIQGLNVYSYASGYVSRIKVSHGGYGKALYIKHPDGNTTVYAHLKKFSSKIEEIVKSKQYKRESYEIEFFPKENEISVLENEIIAFSGNTGGTTGPHLHFEVRDKNQIPINPLINSSIYIEDDRAPFFKKLFYKSYDSNNVFDSQTELKINKITRSLYVSDTLKSSGKIGIGIVAFDKHNRANNSNGIFKIITSLNNQNLLKILFDSISFDKTKHINTFIDYSFFKNHKIRIQKLFIEENNPLDLYSSNINNGFITIKNKEFYKYEVNIYDANGNKSKLVVPILGVKTNKPLKLVNNHVELTYIERNKKYELEFNSVRVSILEETFYNNLLLEAKFENDILSIDKDTIPLLKPITIYFNTDRYNDSIKNQLYIAKLSDNKKMTSYNYTTDFSNGKKSSTKSLGRYTLGVDTINPAISPIGFKENDWISNFSNLKIKVNDVGSGIRSYNGWINNKWILFELNTKKGILVYDFDDNIVRKAKNNLHIEIIDNVGNRTEYKTTFYRKSN